VGRYEEILHTYPLVKMKRTERSETLEYKIQTPGNYSEESIKHIHRQIGTYLPTKMEETRCSKSWNIKFRRQGIIQKKA
jgi:hypothetical protein